MKKFIVAGLTVVLVILGGCMFPEKFDMRVEFNPDASYAIHFNGQVASVMHLMQIAEAKRALTAAEDAELKAEATKMSKPTAMGTQSAQYIGNARYRYTVDNKYKAGEQTSFLGTLLVGSAKDGVVTVKAATLTPKNKKDFSSLGLAMTGSFSAVLPANAKLISSNADSSSRAANGATTYSWQVKNVELQPKLVFTVSK